MVATYCDAKVLVKSNMRSQNANSRSLTLQEPDASASASACRALVASLLVSERRILTRMRDYCEKRVVKVQTRQNLAPLAVPSAEPIDIEELNDEDEEAEETETAEKPVSRNQEPTKQGTGDHAVKVVENGGGDMMEGVRDIKIVE